VIKTVNGESNPMDLEMVRLAAAGRSDVSVMDATVSAGELGALMQMADCYVSLHRSEGFGLTMAESMILGKPVIATAYSGNLDFMTEENSFLVPHSWAEVPRGAGAYPVGARWAEPDLEVAASMMRTVFEDPGLASKVAAKGRNDMLEHHSTDARARFVRSRFDTIRHTGMTSGGSRVGSEKVGDVAGSLSVSSVSDLVRRGVRRASGQGLARHTEDLGRAVSELTAEVGALRSVHHASDVHRSEQDARLEQAVRDLGHRLVSLEERLGSLERRIGAGDTGGVAE
jgi:hypothetical protein